ncbi:MAG: transposase [Roseibium album]|uniref:transposase n=1 Tax=Roseibium album TaxID=311410 RepID=UPI0032EF037A
MHQVPADPAALATPGPWWQRGAQAHVLGRARGGPGAKIHALSDNKGQPIAFHLTGASVSDFTGAEPLLMFVPENGVLHGNKGYDSDRIRMTVEARGSLPNIPPRKTPLIARMNGRRD